MLIKLMATNLNKVEAMYCQLLHEIEYIFLCYEPHHPPSEANENFQSSHSR